MEWVFEIYTNGSRIQVSTGLNDFGDAERYIYNLYGDDAVIVSQDFVGETKKGGLLGLGGWL